MDLKIVIFGSWSFHDQGIAKETTNEVLYSLPVNRPTYLSIHNLSNTTEWH